MRAVMEQGHSNIGTTADIYSHVMPAMMRGVADKMDAILGSEAGAETRCLAIHARDL